MASAYENDQFAKTLLPTYPLDDAIEWIQKKMEPEDIFTVEQLEQWAADSGFSYTDD